jgi:hypothetical protein
MTSMRHRAGFRPPLRDGDRLAATDICATFDGHLLDGAGSQ